MPNPIGGLLGNWQDPRQAGLLAIASHLLANSGPSTRPISAGQAIGGALQAGQGATMQADQFGMQKQLRDLQMEQMRGSMAAQQGQQSLINNIANTLPPEQRSMFLLNPKGFFEGKVVAPGGALAAPAGVMYQNPALPPKPPFEMSDMTPEQARKFALARARAGGTNVNVGPTGIDYGKPPEGMAWARTPKGDVALKGGPEGFMQPIAVPIAGGPVERKALEKAGAEATKKSQKAMYADVLSKDVDRAIELIEKSAVPITGMAAITSSVPGTTAHDLSKLVDTVKANVGFDRLQQMRESSPTGGALGQVSEFENRLLQSTVGNLEQSQSKEQMLYNLRRVKDMYLDIIHGPGNRPGEEGTSVSPETMKLIEKYAPSGR